MKTTFVQSWGMSQRQPLFELTATERLIVISALSTFVESFPQEDAARKMLDTFAQIELAMRAMEKCR